MPHTISEPARERLLHLLRLLEKHSLAGKGTVTSAEVERLTGWSRETIRKDISCLATASPKVAGAGGNGGSIGGNTGYDSELLALMVKKVLGLEKRRKFCVVGLGRLGAAYLNFTPTELTEFELAAGFDTNVNRVEILSSQVPLYPAYKMTEVIGRFGIEIAMLCVPSETAQTAAEKCVIAGVRGIMNFAPVVLNLPQEIAVRNMNLKDELRSLSIKIRY